MPSWGKAGKKAKAARVNKAQRIAKLEAEVKELRWKLSLHECPDCGEEAENCECENAPCKELEKEANA